MKTLKALKTLKKYYKEDKKAIILLGFLIIFSNFEVLFFAAIWGYVLEFIMAKKFLEAVLFLLLQLGLFFLDAAINSLINWLQSRLEKSMLSKLQSDLFSKVIDFPAVAFEEHGVGEFNNRILGDTDNIISLFTNFVYLLSRFVAAFLILIVFVKINVVLGLEMLFFAIMSFLIAKYFSPRMKNANKKVKEENDNLMKETTQILSGIREVKALGIKKHVNSLTKTRLDNVFDLSYKNSLLSIGHYAMEWGVYAVFEFITLFTAAFLFYHGSISIAIIVLVSSYLNQINQSVNGYTSFIKDYQKLTVSLERISEILNDKMYKKENFGNNTLNNVNGNIVFNKVSLTYDHDAKPTLKNLSFEIKPFCKTAIVGSSGSGKTSIFNLLLRYFNPTSGNITIDGVNLLDISEESLRENISIIRQDTFLFNMSIMDNFRMVKSDITLKEVRKACKKAYIDNYIIELEKGYDTIVGENGVNLSGGQKQRLSIARALIKDTKIILFDEATSALDNKSQEYIKKTIDNLVKDHTIIIIAHRLSTIIDSDNIILMDKGKAVANGKHKELLKNEIYKELYTPDIIK